jgi:hypothetical protein
MRDSIAVMASLLCLSLCSYLELPLVRTQQQAQAVSEAGTPCSNQTVSNEADYREICYEKDITYSIPFIIEQKHYSLAADFTTPLSWIKGRDCKVEGTARRCHRLTETVAEKMREETRRSKLHKKADHQLQENAIIEGSSERIRGEIEKEKDVSLTVKDSNRLNSLLELIMLGLFIYGEKDNITLTRTNFVRAMFISPNLDSLSDGAISLRFDNTAENSFL